MDVLLIDDHVLVRDGIKLLLEEEHDINVIDEGSNGIEALQILEKQQPDVLITDIKMPHLNGIELVKEVQKHYSNIKTIMLSMHDSEEYVLEAIEAGADGYLLKGSSKSEFLKALRTVASSGKYFAGDISAIIVKNMMGGDKKEKSKDKIQQNEYNLTKREKQILGLILSGKSNKEVAAELDVSKRTAEVHRFNLMKKLSVKNLMELSNKVSELNLDY